jgi:Ca2+-binding RTX toxin-like protein
VGTGAPLAYSLYAGTGADTLVIVKPSPNAMYGLYGFTNIIGPNENNIWSLTGEGSGTISSFTFSGTRNLFGGALRDVFQFNAATAAMPGRIDGGAGSNWLDYSAISSSVIVNLRTGGVSRVAGGVSRIDNVMGSAVGRDKIYGSVAGGVLVTHNGYNLVQAGAGRSVVIGGIGKNTLIGGAADDIIIDGRTRYDADHVALERIRATLHNTSQTFAKRVATLRNAANPFVLKVGTSVFLTPRTAAMSGPRLLIGNGGASWYFTVNAGKIASFKTRTDVWSR